MDETQQQQQLRPHAPKAPPVVFIEQHTETSAGSLVRGFFFGVGAGVGLLVAGGLALHALGVELPSRA